MCRFAMVRCLISRGLRGCLYNLVLPRKISHQRVVLSQTETTWMDCGAWVCHTIQNSIGFPRKEGARVTAAIAVDASKVASEVESREVMDLRIAVCGLRFGQLRGTCWRHLIPMAVVRVPRV